MITLGDWTFQQLDISNKEMYSRYVAATEYPTNHSRSHFDYVWGNSGLGATVLWKEIDGMLAVFKYIKRTNFLYLPYLPLGPGSPDHVAKVLLKAMTFCLNWNKNNKVTRVDVMTDLQHRFLRRSLLFRRLFRTVVLIGQERTASVQKLVTLAGAPFASIRNTINKFYRDYPDAIIRRAGHQDKERLLALKRAWNHSAGAKYRTIVDDLYYRNIIHHFHKLNHIIIVMEINGEVIAMISAAITPDGQVCGGVFKYIDSYKGVSTVMYIEMAKEIHRVSPQTELFNLGTDIGVGGGLILFKNKLRPVLNTKRLRLFLNSSHE